ncbi:hypothetical protein H8959_020151 [Pygathrix nigripes]
MGARLAVNSSLASEQRLPAPSSLKPLSVSMRETGPWQAPTQGHSRFDAAVTAFPTLPSPRRPLSLLHQSELDCSSPRTETLHGRGGPFC